MRNARKAPVSKGLLLLVATLLIATLIPFMSGPLRKPVALAVGALTLIGLLALMFEKSDPQSEDEMRRFTRNGD